MVRFYNALLSYGNECVTIFSVCFLITLVNQTPMLVHTGPFNIYVSCFSGTL